MLATDLNAGAAALTAAMLIWTMLLTIGILKAVDLFTPVRADADEELSGLDSSQHQESGYNIR